MNFWHGGKVTYNNRFLGDFKLVFESIRFLQSKELPNIP